MQVRKHRAALVAALATTAVVATGCGSDGGSSSSGGAATQGASGPKPVTIGILVPSTTNPYWNALLSGARAQAAKMPGVKLNVQASSDDSDVPGGLAKLDAFQTKGVDAVAAVAYIGEPMRPKFEQLVAQKIPVVFLDTKVPDWDGETSFIATDNFKGGEIAGAFIKQQLGGPGEVGFIECSQKFQSCRDRVAGAKKALTGSGIKIDGPLDGDCNPNTTVSVTQDMLTAHPKIKMFYAGCGQSALGASTALAKSGHHDVTVIGFDGAPDELTAIGAGKQLATVAQLPLKIGSLGVKNAVAAARGESVPKQISSGQVLVTKDNVAQFKADSQDIDS
ncbi:MAG: transporter substrate-binding protein [Conexibacter sp.]|nr:transporter substrate-binding protein [Conexibacter sp.]